MYTIAICICFCLYIGWLSTDTQRENGLIDIFWDSICNILVVISIAGIVQALFSILVDFNNSRWAFTLSLSDDVVHDDGGFDDDLLFQAEVPLDGTIYY